MERKSAWMNVVVVAAGLMVLTLAGFLQYRAKIAAYAGAETLMSGERLGVTKMAEGMFNSIIMSVVLGTVVCITVISVAYVTRSVLAGACVFVLSVIPAGVFGSLIATYLGAHELARITAPAGSESHFTQWKIAFGQMWIPGIAGLVISFFVVRSAEERRLREMNRPIILTKEEREARDAELEERERRARENAERAGRVMPGVATAQTATAATLPDGAAPTPSAPMPDTAAVPVSTVSPAAARPQVPAPVASAQEPIVAAAPLPDADPTDVTPLAQSTPVPRAERRSVACPKCGASNAPVRDRCLFCNSALAGQGGT